MQLCAHYVQELKTQIAKDKQVRSTFALPQSTSPSLVSLAYLGLLEETSIAHFYRKLHQHYESVAKQLHRQPHLDEECFLRQKVVYTPKKRSLPTHPDPQQQQQPRLSVIDSDELLFEKVGKKVKLNGNETIMSKSCPLDFSQMEVPP